MTLASLLFGVVIALAQGIMRWDRTFNRPAAVVDQWARLAEDIRVDIRQATAVMRPSNKQLVIQLNAAETIRYDLSADGCMRTIAPRSASGRQTEFFSIDGAETWELDIVSTGRLPRIVATLTLAAGEIASAASVQRTIVAALGADRRPVADKE
jgi:hypothetical protein